MPVNGWLATYRSRSRSRSRSCHPLLCNRPLRKFCKLHAFVTLNKSQHHCKWHQTYKSDGNHHHAKTERNQVLNFHAQQFFRLVGWFFVCFSPPKRSEVISLEQYYVLNNCAFQQTVMFQQHTNLHQARLRTSQHSDRTSSYFSWLYYLEGQGPLHWYQP